MSRVGLICGLLLMVACSMQTSATKPNLLLVLTDDQGYGDLALHGNDTLDTPTLDFLGQEGIRLTRFYVSPVCAPTRASLLTGRYHYRTGTSWVTRNAEAMRSNETTLAELFQANDYRTGCFGKWHNGAHYPQNPHGQGFDDFTGFCAGHLSNYFDPVLEQNGSRKQFPGYINDIVTNEAIEFIKASDEDPFFCYVPYNTPHTPYILPDKFFEKYLNKGCNRKLASTYGMVENIDQNLSRIINALDSMGKLENTLIVFMTDNGPNYDRFNAGMKGRKGWVNDGGVRVPCFFYWKNKFETRTIDHILSHIDFYKTIEELFNMISIETKHQDGQSFAKLLAEPKASWPDRNLFTFSMNFDQFRGSVRNTEWRLVVEGEGQYQLTRMTDTSESIDVKSNYPDIADNLYDEYLLMYENVTRGLDGFLPIPIGYSTQYESRLLANEGYLSGGIRYKASRWGWAHDWVTGWKSERDTLYWDVEVAQNLTFIPELYYNATDTGVVFHLGSQQHLVSGIISRKTNPEIIPNFEKVPREVEAFEQTWEMLELPPLKLTPSDKTIYLSATNPPILGEVEIKEIVLRAVP